MEIRNESIFMEEIRMKKFVLYTAIFGTPARFNIPEISIPDVDKFCYTDLPDETGHTLANLIRRNHDIKTDFYRIKRKKFDHLIPVMRQRFIKICIPDEIFDNYEYSIYVDCKRPVLVDFEQMLSCMEPQSDVLIRRHRRRNCVYDEGKFCIKKKNDLRVTILSQLDYYTIKKYPAYNGLYRTGLLLRRHTKRMKEFSKLWWAQLEKYSQRDQISLPYVAWEYGMKISLYERGK